MLSSKALKTSLRANFPMLASVIKLVRPNNKAHGKVAKPVKLTEPANFTPVAKLSECGSAWNETTGRFALTIHMREALKWGKQQAKFASVFTGGDDRLHMDSDFDLAVQYMAETAKIAPVSLVSVIGSCAFIELVERVPFTRVVLFDENICEFAKVATALDLMNEDPAIEPLERIEKLILSDPRALIPSIAGSDVSFELGTDAADKKADASFPCCGVGRRGEAWSYRHSREKAESALKNLKGTLCEKAFIEIPRLDAEGQLIVVFLSNVSKAVLSDAFVRKHFTNSAGVLVLRSMKGFNNEPARHPHPYWEAAARSLLFGHSHQIFIPEKKLSPDETYPTTTSSVLNGGEVPPGTESVLTHILVGKAKGDLKRRADVIDQLRRLPPSTKRVVVSEWRPEGPQAQAIESGFQSTDDLITFYSKALPDFRFDRAVYSPGVLDPRRNLFAVFERHL